MYSVCLLITAHLFLEVEEFASFLDRTDNPPSIIAHNRMTFFLNKYSYLFIETTVFVQEKLPS